MDWYTNFKMASGQFRISNKAKELANYFTSQTRKRWIDGNFEISDLISMQELLSLDVYKSTVNSPYIKIFNSPNAEIGIMFNFLFHSSNINKIKADVSKIVNRNSNVFMNLNMFVNEKEYQSIKESSYIETDKFFESNFLSTETNIGEIIEHEFIHLSEYLLGYDKENTYIVPDNTESSFLKYIGQQAEREPMYSVIYNGLINAIEKEEKTAYQAFQVTFYMYTSIKKHYTNDLKNFFIRINGLLNKIDEKYSGNMYWTILRNKMVKIIKGDLEIS